MAARHGLPLGDEAAVLQALRKPLHAADELAGLLCPCAPAGEQVSGCSVEAVVDFAVFLDPMPECVLDRDVMLGREVHAFWRDQAFALPFLAALDRPV